MKVSSVSPLQPQKNYDFSITQSHLLWLVITPQPARLDIFTASMLSVTEPIWLTFNRRALQDFSLIAFCTRCREEEKFRISLLLY